MMLVIEMEHNETSKFIQSSKIQSETDQDLNMHEEGWDSSLKICIKKCRLAAVTEQLISAFVFTT